MDQQTQEFFKLDAGNRGIRISCKLTPRQWIGLYWPAVLSVAAIVISLVALGLTVARMLGA